MSALKCLDACDEEHDIGCPVFEKEAERWAAHFGLKPNTPENRAHNQAMLRAFAPPGREDEVGGGES